MKTYFLSVKHNGKLLDMLATKGNNLEGAVAVATKAAIGRGFQNFQVEESDEQTFNEFAAAHGKAHAANEAAAAEKKQADADQALIDKTVAFVQEYFGADKVEPVAGEGDEVHAYSLIDAHGKEIISGPLHELNEKALNGFKIEPAKAAEGGETDPQQNGATGSTNAGAEKTFEQWHAELVELAAKADFPLAPDAEAYRECFDMGDTPQDTLDNEMDAATS